MRRVAVTGLGAITPVGNTAPETWRAAVETFADHLSFALRHESIDLLILKRIFDAATQSELEAFIRDAPTGNPARS